MPLFFICLKFNSCSFIILHNNCSKDEIRSDQAIRTAITEQTNQWTEMITRHKKEEWDLLRQQVQDQQEILKKLMEQVQTSQMKQLEARQER